MRRRDRRVRHTLLTIPSINFRAISTDRAFIFIVDDTSLLVRMFEWRLDVLVDCPLSIRSRHGEAHLAYGTPRWRVVRQQPPGVRLVRNVDVPRSAPEGARERTERSGDQYSRIRRGCGRRGSGRGGRDVHAGQSRWRKRSVVIVHATTGDALLLNEARVSVVGVGAGDVVGGDDCAGGVETVGCGIRVRLRRRRPRKRRDRIVLRHRPTSQFKMLGLATRRCVHATLPVLLLLLRLQLFFLLPVIREMDTVTDLCAPFCSSSATSTSCSSSAAACATRPNSTRRREDPSRRSCSQSPCCFWRGW